MLQVQGTKLTPRTLPARHLLRSASASRLQPARLVIRMQSQTPVGTKQSSTPASAGGGGDVAERTATSKLQQLEEEDPSFAVLSSPSGSNGAASVAPKLGAAQSPPSEEGVPNLTKLDDLKAEDPAFANLRTEDATAEAARPPPREVANAEAAKPPPREDATVTTAKQTSGEYATNEAAKPLLAEDHRAEAKNPTPAGDATAEAAKPPPADPAAPNGKDAAAKDGQDSLAQDLERLAIGKEKPQKVPLLQSFDLEGIANLIKKGGARKVIVMTGAGISVSAGIPDFRTPGTGLYDNLQKFNLPYPEAVFSLDYFRVNPKPFYRLAKELFPGSFKPTPAHHFMVLLHRKELLLRCFTQNIDSLETQAGLPAEKVVAAHGNFDSARCIVCRTEVAHETVRAAVDAATPCRCPKCNGLVKPDIVFFGESLPQVFFERLKEDFPAADLLVVMGSSLVVQPFATLIGQVDDHVPRLLINRERVAEAKTTFDGFNFKAKKRDCLYLGDCDEGVRQLASLLGWREELEELITGARSVASPI